ncbi:Ent-kaurene oxidase [Podospora australis]|uniref:Ent-kaurene oxidase n=1 Tax=Podospora australis TaxID=1536484 RepID=A0AAN6WPU7_9PEZI|nr:Ent-kaurene oxidase [Podospora australis]
MNIAMDNTTVAEALGPQQTRAFTSMLQNNPVTAVVVSCLVALASVQVYMTGNKVLVGLLEPIKRRLRAWKYLINGMSIIQTGFDKSKGEPYEVLAPDGRYVFVSSPKHIKELDSAPDTILSLQAAAKQMLQPMYTMHAFNWFDRRGTEGVGFVKALRTMLTSNLPAVLPDLSTIIRTRFEELHDSHPEVKGVKQSPVYTMIVKLVVLSNAVSFFGKDLAKNEQFMESALAYIEETLIGAEIVRLLPKFMSPFLGRLMAQRIKAQKVVYDTLVPITEQRCLERDQKNLGQKVPYHADCIQWIMETSPRAKPWTPERIVHELMAIWFGSVHAVSTTVTFAIHDLCLHPEYVEPIRQELLAGYADFEKTGLGLPLLDSFIKESARITPVEAQSTRRAALRPFTLSDGTKLNVGDWACTPVRAMMHDPEFFPEPMQFNGFRFADPVIVEEAAARSHGSNFKTPQPKPSKLTDCDSTYHVWGTGRMACPGRFYATAVMKVILGQAIMNYDLQLLNKEDSRWRTWRSTMLPRHGTKVVFTRRNED